MFTDHKNLTFIATDSNPRVVRWRLYMQDFEFAVAYIPGPNNVVADAMSRLCQEQAEVPTTLMALQASTVDGVQDSITPLMSFDQAALLGTTSPDDWSSETQSLVVDPPQYWLTSPTAQIHHLQSQIHEVHSAPDEQLPAPMDSWKRDIITRCHNTTVGHWGISETLDRIEKLLLAEPPLQAGHSWTAKRRDVKFFVDHCPICQKTRYHRLVTQTRSFVTSNYGLMEYLAIDGLKMSTPCTEGFQWVIVIIDTFSRFVQVYPGRDCSAQTAVECLLQWISTFGPPSHIRIDNSSQFSGEYAELIRLLSIQQHYIAAYSHQENSRVEVGNREILRHLRALLLESRAKERWHITMYIAIRILNSRTIKATGVAPQDLVFAGRLELNRGVLFPRQVHESTTVSNYMRESMDMQEEMLQLAIAQQQASDEAHLAGNGSILPTIFSVGSYVLVRYETDDGRPIDKLAPLWRGPYLITHREPRAEGDLYTCQD